MFPGEFVEKVGKRAKKNFKKGEGKEEKENLSTLHSHLEMLATQAIFS